MTTTPQFSEEAREALIQDGWRLAAASGELTLTGLRHAGVPFKGTKYFQQQAAATQELPGSAGQLAYRPGLMPHSLNLPHAQAVAQLSGLTRLLPLGAVATIAPAALYVWLLVEHHRHHGEWLLAQCFTWAADRSGTTHLAVGVFGRERPILVSPIPEGMGKGVGVMPLIVPSASVSSASVSSASVSSGPARVTLPHHD